MTDFDAHELASPLWAMAMSGADVLDVSEKVKDFDTGLGGIWKSSACCSRWDCWEASCDLDEWPAWLQVPSLASRVSLRRSSCDCHHHHPRPMRPAFSVLSNAEPPPWICNSTSPGPPRRRASKPGYAKLGELRFEPTPAQGQCQSCWTLLQSDCWTSMRSTWPPPSACSPGQEGMGHVWIQGISACVRFWSTHFLDSHCHIQAQKRDI